MKHNMLNKSGIQHDNSTNAEIEKSETRLRNFGMLFMVFICFPSAIALFVCGIIGFYDMIAFVAIIRWLLGQVLLLFYERACYRCGIIKHPNYKKILIDALKRIGIFFGATVAIIIVGFGIGSIIGQPIFGLYILALIAIRIALGD